MGLRKPRVYLYAALILVAFVVVFGVSVMLVGKFRVANSEDLVGEWVLSGTNGDDVGIEFKADGTFSLQNWPREFGCMGQPWPKSTKEVDWKDSISISGKWEQGSIDEKRFYLRPDREFNCWTFTLRTSPDIADSSLHILLNDDDSPSSVLKFVRAGE